MNTSEVAKFLSFEALKYCAENGPTCPLADILKHLEMNVINEIENIEEYSTKYEGHTDPRWVTIMKFNLIDYDKAGWFKKAFPKRGHWTITPEGIEALKKYKTWATMSTEAASRYRKWVAENPKAVTEPNIEDISNDSSSAPLNIDDIIESADLGIRDRLKKLDPYEFQDLVASLLKAMGYFVDFVAPKGKDGGVDLVCYQDPMGVQSPRVKVQIKHMPESTISRPMVSEFADVIKSKDEIGIYVTSGSYTRDARAHSIGHEKHIRLVDGTEFVDLYKEYYEKILGSEEAELLPITKVWHVN